MATLRDIQRRIRSVQSTQKITRGHEDGGGGEAAPRPGAHHRRAAVRAARWPSCSASLVRRAEGDAHPLLARATGGRASGW